MGLRAPAVVVALLAVLLLPGPASADSGPAGADVSVAQSLGDRELTVVLRRVTSVPGPLQVDVVSHAGGPAGQLTLGVAPQDGPDPGVPAGRATLTLSMRPGPAAVTLPIDRAGPWELSLADGTHTARIPFVVHAVTPSPPERYVYGGFVAAGVCLAVALVTGVVSRRVWAALIPGAGVAAGVAVAIVAALLSAAQPAPAQSGADLDPTGANASDPYAGAVRTTDHSRPPLTLALGRSSLPAAPRTIVDLSVTDAANGLPADDLVVHDGGLMHLMVVTPGGTLQHLHPVRVAPARFRVTVATAEGGHYALAAEVARRGGGVQLLRTGFIVTGGVAKPVRAVPPRGSATIDGVPVQVALPDPVAGRPVTLRARIGEEADLQPWLGMLGHLVVVGPGDAARDAPVWLHAHAMDAATAMDGTMADMPAMVPMGTAAGATLPDETVAAYGPVVGFTLAFPQPGTYRLWVQAEKDYRVVTVPVTVAVRAA
ncbi:hypothetical protein [Actinoplanes sp. RD1]|uniref:hypothetical protein n=1 Tax=Actinoplanes sp. RD1 TaxID=3064538 RepID=UPI002740C10A|nr:hypothetical protein [Actinoplanes sp. RD1]